MLDKNKLLSKRNDDLTQTIQKLEEKLKNLVKENLDMVRTQSPKCNFSFFFFFLAGGCSCHL